MKPDRPGTSLLTGNVSAQKSGGAISKLVIGDRLDIPPVEVEI